MNMFKTTTAKTAEEYIEGLAEPRKGEIKKLHDFIRKTVPSMKPFIISGMIGYGSFRYKSKSGREGEWCTLGLASQKNYISLYVCVVDGKQYLAEKYKSKLPKANIGRSCIRIKKTEDIDMKVLELMLKEALTLPPLSST